MTQEPCLSEALDAALSAPGTATATSGDLTIEVEVKDVDRIGVVVDTIRVRGGSGSLHERAERLAEAVRPDGHSLVPIEVDPRLGGGRLRSPVDHRRRYFEANVTPAEVELRRTQVLEDNDRQPSELTVTRDQLGELVDQLEQAVAPLPE